MDNTFINQHNLSQSIFNAGNAGIAQSLAGRVPNVSSLLSGNASVASAMNTINTIPGVGTALNNLEQNPLASLTKFSGLNLQGGLPSLANLTGGGTGGIASLSNLAGGAGSNNPLSEAFSLASTASTSSIPSSVTGVVQLALQVKTIACNLKIPNITAPDISSLLKANFTAMEKQVQQLLLHEVQEIVEEILDPIKKIIDQISDFFSPEKIKKLLASIIPDVNDLITNTVNQFTKCNNGPAAKKNDLSGKNPTGTASAPVPNTIVPPAPSPGAVADENIDTGLDGENDTNAYNQVTSAATSTSPAAPTANNNGNSGIAVLPNNGPTETNYNADGTIASYTANGVTTIPPNSPLYANADYAGIAQVNPILQGSVIALPGATGFANLQDHPALYRPPSGNGAGPTS